MKVLLVLALLYTCAFAAISLTGTVRDFTDFHPDFEHFNSVEKNIPELDLDVDGKPKLSSGAKATVTSAASFAQWFRDTEGVNAPVQVTISLDLNSGVYTYSNDNFFPIDNMGFGNTPSMTHNYGFTSEFRNTFTYQGGETFTITGNDDIWVFINNKRVVDLGGIHASDSATVNLDTLTLTKGSQYELAIFQAERRSPASSLRIETTINLQSEIPTSKPNPGRPAWICEVEFPEFCPGGPIPPPTEEEGGEIYYRSANGKRQTTCPEDPTITFPGTDISYSVAQFNVISLGNFSAPSGDVEGRLAVRGNVEVSQYSVGYELRTGGSAAWDKSLPYTLVAGGNVKFVSGAIYPAGDDLPFPGEKELIFAGGNSAGTDAEIAKDVRGSGCNGNCLNLDFDNIDAYFTKLSNDWNAMPDNAVVALQWGQLQITCPNPADSSISVHVASSTFNQVTSYKLIGCNNNAQIVFNIEITGTQVVFGGDNIYHRQEKVLYNIVGSGKVVRVETEVRGSILAPGHNFVQPGMGVVKGYLIVGNVERAHQINRLRCEYPALPPTPPTNTHTCPYFEGNCEGLNFPISNGVYSFRDFNVVSFRDFNADTGDVEGRVAVKRNMKVGTGYSVGFELSTATSQPDNALPYSLIVGRNLTWGSGSLHPDGTGKPYPGNQEDMFVGEQMLNVYSFLHSRRTGGPCATAGCLDSYFDAAQQCYINFQNELKNLPVNTRKDIYWSGLFITCADSNADRYVVNLTPEEMSQYTYTTIDNCKFEAEWVINVIGSGAVTLSGGSFPALPGGVVYNIVGDRNINIDATRVNGHVLAPQGNIIQPGSVIIGKLIAGNVEMSKQVNKPSCPIPGIVEVPTSNNETTPEGDVLVYLVALSNIRPGDSVFINNLDYNTVKEAYLNPPRIVLAKGVPQTLYAGGKIVGLVDGNAGRAKVMEASSSSIVSVSVALIVAFVALLF